MLFTGSLTIDVSHVPLLTQHYPVNQILTITNFLLVHGLLNA